MKIVGLMPTRGDAGTIGLAARVALLYCDELLVYHHDPDNYPDDCSVDETVEILDGIGTRALRIVSDPGAEWHEMRHRQAMLDHGRAMGGTHFVIVDSDEILTANLTSLVDPWIKALQPGEILRMPLYNVRNGIEQYHSNGIWADRSTSFAFADAPHLGWTGDRFHSREPQGHGRSIEMIPHGNGGVIHLWGASERRLHEKHRMYRIQERLRYPNKAVRDIEEMYSWAEKDRRPMTRDQWTFAPTPHNWIAPYADWIRDYLNLDQEPWQRQWCDDMIAKHGREHFAGLEVD